MSGEPLGYEHNDGGINNQKLALLGLFVAANKSDNQIGRRIYLPNIYNKDQHDLKSSFENFEEIFWLDIFFDFAKRWNIEIVDRPNSFHGDRIERNGWNYFGQGACYIGDLVEHERPNLNSDIASDLFRSLIPKIKSSRIFQTVCDKIFYVSEINTAVQLRIEEDWHNHANRHLSAVIKHEEDYLLSAEGIIKKVANSLPDTGGTVYVSCDERYILLPKWTIRENVLNETGINIVFKSDLISPETFDSIRQVDASLIDFEIGKVADRFVGMTRSTFSNLLCFERHVCTYKTKRHDYIYNKIGPKLGIRTDLGSKDDPRVAAI
ncbi:MAG: O-fucosyltransferase family protein [Methylobacterium frigidaeris]